MAIARPAKRLHAAALHRFSQLLIGLVCLSAGYYLGQSAGSPSAVGRQAAAAAGGGQVPKQT